MAFNRGIPLNLFEEKNDAVICDNGKERWQFEAALVAITVEESLERYCRRIQKPDFWGGESELLVLSKLCKQPIIVYIPEHEHTKGWRGYSFIPIAEYGAEFKGERKGKPKNPVRLLYSATLLTPLAANHSTTSLLLVRAFFGLAEGVALPSMTTLLSGWFPSNERATAVGMSMAGFHLGNVIGLLLTPVMLSSVGVSGPFVLFSSLGLLWLISWIRGVTNHPRKSRYISVSELRLIEAGKDDSPSHNGEHPPISFLLSKLPTWAIILANMTNNWGYFVLLSWMPVYFKTVFGVNLKQVAWFSAIPWGTMAISGYVAVAASDYLIKARYSVTSVQKIMQSIGFIGPGVSLLCLNFATTPTVAAVLLTVALSLSSFSQAGFLLNMQDIAPQYTGFLHGISNSAGTLAAIISTIGTGYFVQWLVSFQAFLTVTVIIYFITVIFWNLFATEERVF